MFSWPPLVVQPVAPTSRFSKSAVLDLETAEKPQSFWEAKLSLPLFAKSGWTFPGIWATMWLNRRLTP